MLRPVGVQQMTSDRLCSKEIKRKGDCRFKTFIKSKSAFKNDHKKFK